MHATAETLRSTDWAQIHELYRMLLTVAPSPAAAAHLLDALGSPEAADAHQRAATLTDSIPEQRYLNAKAQQARN